MRYSKLVVINLKLLRFPNGKFKSCLTFIFRSFQNTSKGPFHNPFNQPIFYLFPHLFSISQSRREQKWPTPTFLLTIRVYFNQHRVQMKCHAL